MTEAVTGCDRVFRPVPTAPERQTIDIERLLVWTFFRQRAHLVAGRGLQEMEANAFGHEREFHGGSNASDVGHFLELGQRVDSSGGGAAHLHPDAERVHRAVVTGRLPIEIVYFASTLSRPDAMVGRTPLFVPALDKRGRVRKVFEVWDKGRRYGRPLLVCTLSQATIDRQRARYAAWHAELVRLRSVLRLETWVPIGPAAPATPWLSVERCFPLDTMRQIA